MQSVFVAAGFHSTVLLDELCSDKRMEMSFHASFLRNELRDLKEWKKKD